ncbi:calpain-7-like, partial [Lingula anatina]|uniref:Calpain-7-like n=1 Tax=Lingula anatina TaxID=7574 RepID=A0A1S3IX10_LINAN
SSIIYPQNRNGEPQYNPCGKYMVKFNINGVHRKVIIDDFLPMGYDGELLCSFSANKNELWVSLLEKAYLKVMGGYDFPGSNSNIDLHALTGWIPERIAIRPNNPEFNKDKEFTKIMDRFHKGHCLVTVATGEMSDAEGERAGLVPTHAYAMLDIREIMGKKLMQLKNPWSHLCWKGNFSERDTTNWTPQLQKALNFDPKSAQMIDNGVFWIDYESILRFYDVIYVNWNPELFGHTTCYHHTWTAKEGPKKDVYNIGDNPQYRLELKSSHPTKAAVWILMTRHIKDRDDFANNREFITVLVYKGSGKRVFYPYDPPPYKDGVRINSPHYLCKMLEDVNGSSTYTLVTSQYEKNNTIHYTLRVYSTCEFVFSKIMEPYNPKYEKQLTGQWKGRTAGGCGNYPDTHQSNPVYQLKLDTAENYLLIELRGPKQYSVGFEVFAVSCNESAGSFQKKTSGDYRRGFCVLQLDSIPGGIYNIMPSTFYPKEEGPFLLNISSSNPFTISQLQ